ncbi:hypothetical protein [Microbacterium sp. VKM Ac-2923]|uniref:hypothetical protein n=1 Tax=Microbacterium sp. VKM Ac-2923 TaxID=2929476 RepID=UPI001FB4668E|nr:hypothetical protein [Microbacterium sp. VKM Ac-2923]MCJ1708433.1 hypothetical protein [Microbacterium sp. VKM Ac-2923]
MSEISSVDATNLAARFKLAMSQGTFDADVSELGAAAKLMVDSSGTPRRDGLALATVFLRESVKAFQASTTAWFNAPHTATQVADTVSSLWGINSAPLTTRQLGAQHGVAPVTVRRWASTVLHDDAFLRRLAEVSAQIPALPATPHRASLFPWSGSASTWPPAHACQAMVSRTRTMMKWPVGEVDDAGIVEILREAVIARLHDYYASPQHALELRHFATKYKNPWVSTTSTLIPQRPPVLAADASTERRRLVDSVALVVQTTFYLLLRNAPEERTLLHAVNEQRRATARTLEIFSHAPVQPRAGVANPLTHSEIAKAEEEVNARSLTRGSDRLASVGSRPSASELLALANEIRGLSRAERVKPVNDYLALRALVEDEHTSETDALILALADQSVHHDVMELGNYALLRHASALADRNHRSRARWAYAILDLRNLSLHIKKGGDYRGALKALRAAYERMIYLLDRYRDFQEGRRFVEVHQQVALALAGFFINLSELLLATGAAPALLRRSLELGQRWVGTARAELEVLEHGGLPDVRHVDHHISSTSWRVQTRVMHVRVLLLRHMAGESGSLGRTPVDQQVMLPDIEPLFRELLRLSDLRPGAAAEIVKLAMWWAFLDDGWVPAEFGLSDALRHLWFIDGDPATLGLHGDSRTRVNLDEATAWLDLRGQDAGVVRHLDESGAAYHLLEERSGRRFGAWRRGNPPAKSFPG